MEERFTLHVYGGRTLKDKFGVVKGYFEGKDPAVKWTDSAVGAGAIDYVYQKIVGAETNANRITTIVERQDRQDARQAQVEETLAQLVATVARLADALEKGVTDEPAT